MSAIHNTKKRMPTILPEEQAYQWIQPNISKEEITRLAAFSIPSTQLSATTIHKDFRTSSHPTEPFEFEELPQLAVP
jgi:putative SOS response-associated peptidase YedK